MPLSNVSVLDLSRFLPGPQCAALLGDYGAKVIRVETPKHAAARDRVFGLDKLGEADRARCIASDLAGRNKDRKIIDFFTSAGQKDVLKIASQSDVFIHDFRINAIEACDLGPDALRAVNPRLIYVAVSATGMTGPRADAPGHDPIAQALAGTVSRSGTPPHLLGFPAADTITAAQAAFAVMVAIRRRDATGEGAVLDVAMSDAALSLMTSVFARQQRTGVEPDMDFPMGDNSVFETADGKHVVATNMERPYWDRFCRAVDRPDLMPLFVGNRPAVLAELATIYASKTRAEWDAFAKSNDLQIAPVLSPAEALDEPHHHDRGVLVRDASGVVLPGRPVRFVDMDAPRPRPAEDVT